MSTKAKTIKMLLYDGSLSGVMNINDSAWDGGKMYSAPRESIDNLISQSDCRKYGVYLLLSDQQVYIGQASDLERRTKQHLTDKGWWTQVILLTTKDDSFNASDIDYLEARLISIAESAGKLNSDNKKRGNPQKVDEFRQAELEQYLDEALFLLELIGVRVFKSDSIRSKKKINKSEQKNESMTAIGNKLPENILPSSNSILPPLPSNSLKVGQFVYTAMRNLSEAGYVFSDDAINDMTTVEWSVAHFHTNKPFMKKFISGQTDSKGSDGRVRFKSQPYTFGQYQVLISKEWFERQRKFFITWYNSLK